MMSKSVQPHPLALGSRFNNFVNRQLDKPTSRLETSLPGAHDTFRHIASRDARKGAQICAAPRHVLNHVFGGAKTKQSKVDALPTQSLEAQERTHGVLWHTYENATSSVARAASGVAGLAGTAIGAAGGLLAPAVSKHSAKDCVDKTRRAFTEKTFSAVKGVLNGLGALVNEATALLSGVATSLLAGCGLLLGGAWGVIVHGPAKATRAAFRREAADAAAEHQRVKAATLDPMPSFSGSLHPQDPALAGSLV